MMCELDGCWRVEVRVMEEVEVDRAVDDGAKVHRARAGWRLRRPELSTRVSELARTHRVGKYRGERGREYMQAR